MSTACRYFVKKVEICDAEIVVKCVAFPPVFVSVIFHRYTHSPHIMCWCKPDSCWNGRCCLSCLYYLRQGGYVFIVFVFLSIIIFVQKLQTDLYEVFRKGW